MPSVRDLDPAGAWRFIILLGVISLFSDITYEGARSISGPFLGELKASALVVGVVAGLGEFLGYTLRLASGYLTDRLGRYWPIVFAGYSREPLGGASSGPGGQLGNCRGSPGGGTDGQGHPHPGPGRHAVSRRRRGGAGLGLRLP